MADDLKARVLAHLPRGKENAITGKELAKQLGERDTRKIRLCIEQLIEERHVICSSNHEPFGYFIATSRNEVDETLKVIKYGYILELAKKHHFLSLARDTMFPQIGMKI